VGGIRSLRHEDEDMSSPTVRHEIAGKSMTISSFAGGLSTLATCCRQLTLADS
jgi:hypothetical protein